MTRQELILELDRKAKQSKSDIRLKVLRNPVKILFPWILEKAGGSASAIIKTFWGGKMEVVLPEQVSAHLYRFGFFDRDVSFYMIESLAEGGVFIDIGSHFGSFSLFASQQVGATGKVIAIDPTPSTFALLDRNLTRFAPFKNFQSINLALYDKPGKTVFYDFGLKNSAYNSLLGSRNESILNSNDYQIEVTTETLDNLVNQLALTRVDFIKIDAESAELAILKGAISVLRTFSPSITVEIGDTGLANAPKSIEIIEFLEEAGYRAFELNDGKIVPHIKRIDYSKDSLVCYNLLFVKP